MLFTPNADIDYIGPTGTMYTSEPVSRGADLPPKLKRRGTFACAIAIVLAGLVYANALDNPFVYDDHRIIVENKSLADLSNVRAILWHEVTRPVVNFSYAIDQAIWGPAPFGFHLTNVLLHMINVGLFALLVWGSTQRPHLIAPMAALLFAVHPMMTEAVGYISGRSEVICGTFFLAALLSARASIVHRRTWWLVPAIVFWLLALGSKEIAAMFPFVALAYDRWVIRGDRAEEKRRLLGLHVPLFGLAAVLVIVRLVVFTTMEHGGGIVPQWSFAFVEIEAMRRYLMMLLLPTGQALYHSISPTGLTSLQTLTAMVVLVLLVGLIWTRRKAAPLQSFGLLWFLLLLLPSSALVILDRGEPMAEHRVYLASCGVFLTLAAAVDAALLRAAFAASDHSHDSRRRAHGRDCRARRPNRRAQRALEQSRDGVAGGDGARAARLAAASAPRRGAAPRRQSRAGRGRVSSRDSTPIAGGACVWQAWRVLVGAGPAG